MWIGWRSHRHRVLGECSKEAANFQSQGLPLFSVFVFPVVLQLVSWSLLLTWWCVMYIYCGVYMLRCLYVVMDGCCDVCTLCDVCMLWYCMLWCVLYCFVCML